MMNGYTVPSITMPLNRVSLCPAASFGMFIDTDIAA